MITTTCNGQHKTLDELFTCNECEKLFRDKCEQCGDTVDLLAQFTSTGVCGTCARRNHKKLMGIK